MTGEGWRGFWIEGGELGERVGKLISEGNFPEAERLVRTAIAEVGLSPQYYVLLAQVYLEWKKYEEAERILLQALGVFGGEPRFAFMFRLLLARAYCEEERWYMSAEVLLPLLRESCVLKDRELGCDVSEIFCRVLKLLDNQHVREVAEKLGEENPLALPLRVVHEVIRNSAYRGVVVKWWREMSALSEYKGRGVKYHFLMGLLGERVGAVRRAISHYLLAYRLCRQKCKEKALRWLATKMAFCYLSIGRWERAMKWAEPVAVKGENNSLRGVALLAMGIASFGMRRYVTACRYFEEVLKSGWRGSVIAYRWWFRVLIKLNPANALLVLTRTLQNKHNRKLDGYPVEFLLCHISQAFAHMGLRNEAISFLSFIGGANTQCEPLFRVYTKMLKGHSPRQEEIRALPRREWRQFVVEECRFMWGDL